MNLSRDELTGEERSVACGLKGRALSALPLFWSSGDVRDVQNLQVGRCGGGGTLDGEDAWNGDKAADVLEGTCSLGSSRDGGGIDKNTFLHIKSGLKDIIRLDIILEMLVDFLEHIRGDGISADRRSSWWRKLDSTA
jgi:hypothetical protein